MLSGYHRLCRKKHIDWTSRIQRDGAQSLFSFDSGVWAFGRLGLCASGRGPRGELAGELLDRIEDRRAVVMGAFWGAG